MDFEVFLRIYDLSQGKIKPIAKTLGLEIEGIWHTSIEVFGQEYYFQTGVVYTLPGKTTHGEPLNKLSMGKTFINKETFHQFIEEMKHKYNHTSYDLFKNNCNHFTNDASNFLVSKSIPEYILFLPEVVMKSPLYGLLNNFIVKEENEEEEETKEL